jgi:hypothetical protein
MAVASTHYTQRRRNLRKLYSQAHKVPDALEEKLTAIKCESGNVEVQWNNIKKYALVIWFGNSKGKKENHELHRK